MEFSRASLEGPLPTKSAKPKGQRKSKNEGSKTKVAPKARVERVLINNKNTQYAVIARMSKILGWQVSQQDPESKDKSAG